MADHQQIQLSNGALIGMAALNQRYTYEGLIEGVPTREMNGETIKAELASAQRLWSGVPYLIQPQETPIRLDRESPYPFGTPAKIPPIMCVSRWCGEFGSRQDVETGEELLGCAELTILWFQHEFALPIAPDIVSQIEAIDWERHSIFVET